MKQTRRGFLGRVAAIAAAVAVAPAAKAEAGPKLNSIMTTENDAGPYWGNTGRTPPDREYGNDLGEWQAPNLWPYWDDSPPTFEAMQADCVARGCFLMVEYPSWDFGQHVMHDTPGRVGAAKHIWTAGGIPSDLARVDEWRRGLHTQASTVALSGHTHIAGPSTFTHHHHGENVWIAPHTNSWLSTEANLTVSNNTAWLDGLPSKYRKT